MAKRKRPPTESQLTVRSTTAFARRQRTEGDGDEPAPAPPDKVADGSGPTKASDRAADAGTVGPVAEPDAPSVAGATAAATAPAKPADPASTPVKAADPAPVKAADPAPVKAADPAPAPAAPAAAPVAPAAPAEPAAAAPFPLMPDPSQIPAGDPDDPADAPGLVPPGDSRSLRRGSDFVLVYRLANIVVSRFGAIGRRGQFRVVEYPTTTYAANAYARECSRWVGEGYSDYREP